MGQLPRSAERISCFYQILELTVDSIFCCSCVEDLEFINRSSADHLSLFDRTLKRVNLSHF